MIYKEKSFIKARPIWEVGKQMTLNHTLLFETEIDKGENILLRVTGYTGYQIFINGKFIHWGPARAGREYYRVDELELDRYITEDKNKITVISTGYYCESFQWFKEPSFFCAEIETDGEIICYTGDGNWKAYSYDDKIQRVQRYSFMRGFAEVYDHRKCEGNIRSSNGRYEVETEFCEGKRFIERELSYPDFPTENAEEAYGYGSVAECEPERYFKDRAIENATVVGYNTADGFARDSLEYLSIHMAQRLSLTSKPQSISLPLTLSDTYVGMKMKQNTTGLISTDIYCYEDTDIYLTFDELLVDGKIDFTRNETSNVILYRLKGGYEYKLITAEPYTFKYVNVISQGGKAELRRIGLIRTDFNACEIIRCLNKDKANDVIERIYNAAVETFRQNTFDIFMDCPSRERAGYLCDSFFTSRVERLMTGRSTVERCFLSNFAMQESYKNIPDGMLPMCYPSDFRYELYIPNWAMWFLLELKEYFDRTGDVELVNDVYPKMKRLSEYFSKYENENGLLQKLKGWVFVEWSMCNKLVKDVNYPSNMLYYKFLTAMYELYGENKYKVKAEKLRKAIRKESRMGLFFCDNSVFDKDGKLSLSGECTETCQYYAFFTGVATIEEDRELWNTMVNDFGPQRKQTGKWQEIHPSNAFIGNYLRLELLSNAEMHDKLESDICGYFDYMAKRTGTLWEYDSIKASCNHGFASHVLVWFDKLGYLTDKNDLI